MVHMFTKAVRDGILKEDPFVLEHSAALTQLA